MYDMLSRSNDSSGIAALVASIGGTAALWRVVGPRGVEDEEATAPMVTHTMGSNW
jgi:hypothetical protein